ncbi:MAG: hypothetical protein RIC55_35925 [Pirellulaceae bacterium]
MPDAAINALKLQMAAADNRPQRPGAENMVRFMQLAAEFSRGNGRRPENFCCIARDASFAVEILSVRVPFPSGGLQIEHEILHVEAQLAERLLDKGQDAAASAGALGDANKDRIKLRSVFRRQRLDGGRQFEHIAGKFFRLLGGTRLRRHEQHLQKTRGWFNPH